MVRQRSDVSICTCVLLLATACATTPDRADDAVRVEVGFKQNAPGDDIKILEVRGDDARLTVGHRYRLSGSYTLASRDKAVLALWCANGDVEPVNRELLVERGTGPFEFDFRILREGYLHVTFYPVEGGEGFSTTYFGQGAWVRRQ